MEVDVKFYKCDWPGCSEMWPINTTNGSMLLTFAVHPEIIKMRKGRVVLEKNQYNFCKCHCKEVEGILGTELMKARWKMGPNLDPRMGCWVWAYEFDGNPDQLLFDHQVEYVDLEKLYYYFRAQVLSPKNGEDEVKVFI
ncbi:MAG: hypothetical protein PHP25_00790 [Candidatus Moranbacteria bacterium]|nr:hypothetical protein [Candidatus Moranbacteria bacterium]